MSNHEETLRASIIWYLDRMDEYDPQAQETMNTVIQTIEREYIALGRMKEDHRMNDHEKTLQERIVWYLDQMSDDNTHDRAIMETTLQVSERMFIGLRPR